MNVVSRLNCRLLNFYIFSIRRFFEFSFCARRKALSDWATTRRNNVARRRERISKGMQKGGNAKWVTEWEKCDGKDFKFIFAQILLNVIKDIFEDHKKYK